MVQHDIYEEDYRRHRKLLGMGVAGLRAEELGTVLVIEPVDAPGSDDGDSHTDEQVHFRAELPWPVVKIEIESQGNGQENNR